MNNHQKIMRLGEIIKQLTEFYGELTEELPQLTFVYTRTQRCYSELKKMAVK